MNENEFLDKVKVTFDQHVDELDDRILDRLDDARNRALHSEEAVTEPNGKPWFTWRWAGSVVTASIAAVFWLLNPIAPLDSSGSKIAIEYAGTSDRVSSEISSPAIPLDQDAISDEDISMLDNIEFVAWLMEQEDSNAG